MNNNKRDELADWRIVTHYQLGYDAAKSDSAQEIDKLKKQNERLSKALRFVKNCLGSFKIDAVMIDKINEVLSEHETEGE